MYWERRLQEEAFQRALAEERLQDVEMQAVEDLQETATVAGLLAQLFNTAANAFAPPPSPPSDPSLAPTLLLPPPDAAQSGPQPHPQCIIQTLAASQSPTQMASIDKSGCQLIGANANASRIVPAIDASCAHASIENADVSSWAHALPAGVVRIAIAELEMSDGELGRGGFGVVKRALWTNREAKRRTANQTEVAVKLLHLEKFKKRGRILGVCSELELFVRELHIMAALGTHPNLVQLYGYGRILLFLL